MSSITSGVEKRVLGNGLRVLLKEQRSAPVTAVVAHVRVGYFNEPDRWNGISHVVEHMLFKGTRKRPGKEQIAEDVRALGGSINAGTYYEDTMYYITVPSEATESAVEILADMLRNSLIDPEELARELEVIIQESKQKRDNPRAMLYETMYAKAFDRHRIRRWRIGEDETLRGFRHKDLAEFISQAYRPDNIVLSIVGDVEAEAAAAFVERYWGDMARSPATLEISPAETRRPEFRSHRMTADIRQRLLVFGFQAPPVLSEETPAHMILDAVLSDGRSSRLYRSLKEERGLVSSASSNYEGFEHLGLFTLSAESLKDDALEVESALFEEVAALIDRGVSEEELKRVKTRLDSRWVFAQEEVMGLARTLASYEVLGGYELADAFRANLDAVRPDQVLRAAAETIRPERATLVEYLPDSDGAGTLDAARVFEAISQWGRPTSPAAAPGPMAARTTAAEVHRARARTATGSIEIISLANGAILLYRHRDDLPVVAVHVLIPGGRAGETSATAGITNLLLKSSVKGTRSHPAKELAERIESLGTSISTALAADYIGFSMKMLSHRAADGLALLREVISAPTLLAEEIAREKETIYAEIRRQKDSMFARAIDLFNRARFDDHPYGLPASGDESAVSALTESDIRAWHGRWMRSEGAIIAVVGDISRDHALELLSESVPAGPRIEAETPAPAVSGGIENSESIDRHQTASVMGFDGPTMSSGDRHAMDLVVEITSGLAGRFFQAVRGDRGLAYAVSSFNRPRGAAGTFGTYTATSPENETVARDIILAECALLGKEPVRQEELRDAKAAIRGEQVIHTQTFGAQAAELAVNRLYGLPLDEPERYLERLDSITPGEIMEAARKYLSPERCWLGVVRGTDK